MGEKKLFIVLDENLYFKLVELKGKMKAETWEDLLEKFVKLVEENEVDND